MSPGPTARARPSRSCGQSWRRVVWPRMSTPRRISYASTNGSGSAGSAGALSLGRGGVAAPSFRVNPTTPITGPAWAVVTPIGRDHAEYLGNTVESVATEKAGIFKPGCPAVIAAQNYAEADAVLCRRAEAVGAGPIL